MDHLDIEIDLVMVEEMDTDYYRVIVDASPKIKSDISFNWVFKAIGKAEMSQDGKKRVILRNVS